MDLDLYLIEHQILFYGVIDINLSTFKERSITHGANDTGAVRREFKIAEATDIYEWETGRKYPGK
jgi:hypothetical protein